MAANYTPMVQQYLEVKRQHQDELLFFRLGDFYEMFFDDALTASRELNITLTGRAAGLEERIPMCGVPYHSVDGYIAKLIKKGYRIAICEQVEDPKLAKGIVERKVIKIITPGTALNEQLLDDKHNRFLVFLQPGRRAFVPCGGRYFYRRVPVVYRRRQRNAERGTGAAVPHSAGGSCGIQRH